jgi:hypothetical protein
LQSPRGILQSNGCRDKGDHFIDSGSGRVFSAFSVWDQRGDFDTCASVDSGDNLRRIPHLGDGLGRDEGGHLHAGKATPGKRIYKLDLGFSRNERLFHLKAIAWPDFDDCYLGWKCHFR